MSKSSFAGADKKKKKALERGMGICAQLAKDHEFKIAEDDGVAVKYVGPDVITSDFSLGRHAIGALGKINEIVRFLPVRH